MSCSIKNCGRQKSLIKAKWRGEKGLILQQETMRGCALDGEWSHKRPSNITQPSLEVPRGSDGHKEFPKLTMHSSSWEFLGHIAPNLQTVFTQFLFSFFFSHTGHSSSSSDVLQQPGREEAGSFNEKFPGET